MLSKLEGRGWLLVEPPFPEDGESVVARYDGEPVRAGFLTEKVQESDEEAHFKYRSGRYDLEVKIDFDIGRGQVRVCEAEGYSN